MPRRPKYRLPKDNRKRGPGYWPVLVFLLAGVGWVILRGTGFHLPKRLFPGAGHASKSAGSSTVGPVIAFPSSSNGVPPHGSATTTTTPPARILVSTNLIPGTTSTNSVEPGTNAASLHPARGSVAMEGSRTAQTVLDAQIVLSRRGISCGSTDGTIGSQTRAALRSFQEDAGLPVTGQLDEQTRLALALPDETTLRYTPTAEELAMLAPVPSTWLGKSERSHLGFETVLELVAEKSHAHPALIQKLNPAVDWRQIRPGTSFIIPNAEYPPPSRRAARIRISLSQRTLRAFDDTGRLLVHFPVSIARRVDKRPVGELHVEVAIRNPNYTFNPDVFPESEEGRRLRRKLVLPPGPNNPVGIAWIGLDRPGYGIHGTPHPEAVGRTESHGCFRLANWNADYLRQLVSIGTPVVVEP